MRIERHDVDATALAAAETGFAERIAGDVRRMRHDEHPARGWWSVAGAFLDYLGARSLRSPALEGKDAQAALGSAAAAALAALELTLFPGRPVDVFIDYAGVGVSYGGEFERRTGPEAGRRTCPSRRLAGRAVSGSPSPGVGPQRRHLHHGRCAVARP
ncbi:hypothetical protein ACFYN0_18510 [Streptomyces sp. NPDC006704]|uniref:hypothetical protein n=1 Tax=Streptomyces sp. NPDC006704 TaxID=3364760 RepID=UPI0036AF6601